MTQVQAKNAGTIAYWNGEFHNPMSGNSKLQLAWQAGYDSAKAYHDAEMLNAR